MLNKTDIIQQIERALIRYQLIFFRNQHLTGEEHRDFARLFGNLHIHPFYSHVENIPELMLIEYSPEKKASNDSWHTDVTFTSRPPLGCVLYAREIPSIGGDTI